MFYTSARSVRIAARYCRPTRRLRGSRPSSCCRLIRRTPDSQRVGVKGYGALSAAPRGKLRSHRQFNPGYPNLRVDVWHCGSAQQYAYRGFYVDASAWNRIFC